MYLGYQDNKIKFYTENELPIEFYNLDKSEYTEEEYVLDGEEYVLKDEEWERRQAEKERERLNELSMTRSDFFDGMIMAFGLDSKELRVIVENVLNSINITPVQIRVALNNYDNALNFYRKHTLFELLSGIKISVTEDKSIFITSKQWDRFFETKDWYELVKEE